jgi:DNA-binding transcriptional ArsR family regulator
VHDVLRSLVTARRQELLRLCWDEERAAGDLHRALPDVTFGAISQHLARLQAAGLVTVRKEGRRRLYRARKEALGPLGRMLESMWQDALWRLKLRAELAASRRGPRRRPPSRSRKARS